MKSKTYLKFLSLKVSSNIELTKVIEFMFLKDHDEATDKLYFLL